MNLFEYRRGEIPFLLSIPHGGTWVPDELRDRMTPEGKAIRDTDWFLQTLYDFEELTEASVVASNVSRYVVDLNRAKEDTNLYPGQNTTGLIPVSTFEGKPIYLEGKAPTETEIESRISNYWEPYHQKLSEELDYLVSQFGRAILLDGHSIASELPWLFAGRLPDFNFGTNRGESCEPNFQQHVEAFSASISNYSSVVNDRFVGGFITRNYGSRPSVDAIQLELSQVTYMNEEDLSWNAALAAEVQLVIRQFVSTLKELI